MVGQLLLSCQVGRIFLIRFQSFIYRLTLHNHRPVGWKSDHSADYFGTNCSPYTFNFIGASARKLRRKFCVSAIRNALASNSVAVHRGGSSSAAKLRCLSGKTVVAKLARL